MNDSRYRYKWHVFWRTDKREMNPFLREFDTPIDAADFLFELWDQGVEDVELLPVLK